MTGQSGRARGPGRRSSSRPARRRRGWPPRSARGSRCDVGAEALEHERVAVLRGSSGRRRRRSSRASSRSSSSTGVDGSASGRLRYTTSAPVTSKRSSVARRTSTTVSSPTWVHVDRAGVELAAVDDVDGAVARRARRTSSCHSTGELEAGVDALDDRPVAGRGVHERLLRRRDVGEVHDPAHPLAASRPPPRGRGTPGTRARRRA